LAAVEIGQLNFVTIRPVVSHYGNTLMAWLAHWLRTINRPWLLGFVSGF